MNNKDPRFIILDKITELYISKGRTLDKAVGKVWVESLVNRYPLPELLKGIDKMIWAKDDFPSLSKIGDFTEQEMEWSELMNKTDMVLLEDEKKLQLEDKS